MRGNKKILPTSVGGTFCFHGFTQMRTQITQIRTQITRIKAKADLGFFVLFFICGKIIKMANLLYNELSYKLRGLFFKIRNTYGPGQKEIIYHNILVELLKENKISFLKEKTINIYSENKKVVGVYRPDFIIDDKIILEIKSSRISVKADEEQLFYYLRNSKYEIGFLVNFSTPHLYIKRIIYTNDRKPFLQSISV